MQAAVLHLLAFINRWPVMGMLRKEPKKSPVDRSHRLSVDVCMHGMAWCGRHKCRILGNAVDGHA